MASLHPPNVAVLPFELIEARALKPVVGRPAARQLPFYVAPAPEEALYSWMLRLASRLDTSVHALALHTFGIDDRSGASQWWCRPNPWLLARISERTGIPAKRLRRMALLDLEPASRDDEASERFTQRRYDTSPPNWRAYRFVACRQCLQGDTEPYLRWPWLLGWMAICPRHETVMIDRCRKCHTKLRVAQFHIVRPFSPACCTRCDESLLIMEDIPAHTSAVRLQAALLQAKREGATMLPGLGRFTWQELVSLIDVIAGMTVTDTTTEELHGILLRYQFELRDAVHGHETSLSARYGSLLFIAWMIEGWPDSTGAEVGRDMLARWASDKPNRISRHLGAKWANPWSPGPNDIPPEVKDRICQLLG